MGLDMLGLLFSCSDILGSPFSCLDILCSILTCSFSSMKLFGSESARIEFHELIDESLVRLPSQNNSFFLVRGGLLIISINRIFVICLVFFTCSGT